MSFNLFIVLFFIGGWLLSKIAIKLKLPSILGMLSFGIILSVVFKGNYPEPIDAISPFLKTVALLVILLRAGLGISKSTLEKVGRVAFSLGIVPCLLEALVLTVAFYYLVGLPVMISILSAFIIAAVSPAVVVPSMLDFKQKGYGTKDDAPTMVLAGASLDDVFAITLFTLCLGVVTKSTEFSYVKFFMSIPISILGAVFIGFIAGIILSWFFAKFQKQIRATEKLILLLVLSLLIVELGNLAGLASLLTVMTVGFILLEKNEEVAHELAQKLSKVWVGAEIILFVLIGMAVDINVALKAGKLGFLIILLGLLARSLATFIATYADSKLSFKTRLFCVVSYLPKATVQAALGSIPLSYGIEGGSQILAIAVLSIVISAPLGLILIRSLGPRLLR